MALLSPFWDFFDLAINQIAKTGLSSLQVIYYFENLFSLTFTLFPKLSGGECQRGDVGTFCWMLALFALNYLIRIIYHHHK
ncbi:hypothetical protein KKJ06_00505 [Xenorhabdus bovienii]|uniref:hypothetical protein n=1 Tax=Xenorhabdus bovienii TaxID=40576 RepID=UPI0023B2D5DE|nr:hypothetical protein [Xenorhabdus bovienii]MDE9553959.1 hypothetical protein [Xenorhabdus bovienii]